MGDMKSKVLFKSLKVFLDNVEGNTIQQCLNHAGGTIALSDVGVKLVQLQERTIIAVESMAKPGVFCEVWILHMTATKSSFAYVASFSNNFLQFERQHASL